MLITCILANGHVLIEGMPGVAKTLMARLTAKLIDAKFSRIQFTPDLMPSDVLGTSVFSMKTSEFDFHPGPVFANIVLADEISPDTCRFWDAVTGEKLDKDRFRRDMGGVEGAYQEMMKRVFG